MQLYNTCKICNSPYRDAINENIKKNMKGLDIVEKYKHVIENFSSSNLSHHKRRHLFDDLERLEEIYEEGLKKKISPTSITELEKLDNLIKEKSQEDYLSRKTDWNNEFEQRYDDFEFLLQKGFFNEMSENYRKWLCRLVRYCFYESPPGKKDIGEFIPLLLSIEE